MKEAPSLTQAIDACSRLDEAPSPSEALIAKAYYATKAIHKFVSAIEKRIDDYVKSRPERRTPLGNGKALAVIVSERETLSAASIKAALEPVEATKLLEKLRKLGCFKISEVLQVREVNME